MRKFRKTIRDPESLHRKNRGRARTHFDITMDFHGYTAQEAIAELEEELFSNDCASILIVHGKGNGILRRAVREYLKECEDVTVEYGESANIPGGDGVTAVFIH